MVYWKIYFVGTTRVVHYLRSFSRFVHISNRAFYEFRVNTQRTNITCMGRAHA